MHQQNINGINDWKKYIIVLKYPKEADTIYVSGFLGGKGEIWFDDFKLKINEQDIQFLKQIEKSKIIYEAQLDNEFDKGSNLVIQNLNEQQIENLELLGRTWFFLKYHHPAVAKGEYNWDYELFRILPNFLGIKNTKKEMKF